ncbi:polygalacturonase At1g48100-like [Cryptomeria japonica]|uniref:polygalacturonase At1g48100-like n=1 Tax=Cryptomeria japonica TaxID=3369 RepID=UPI0027DA5681|nr:polygalacturonase At1g48100-like [Cryptomeria japonica]
MSANKMAYVIFVSALVFGVREKCSGTRAATTKSTFRTSFTHKSDGNMSLVDVGSFGAKGNGVTDDTEAFEAAWRAACSKGYTTLHIPANYSFVVGPITFSGPCQSSIVFMVDGNIVAHLNPRTWPSKRLQWINFSKVHGINVMGKGVLDGQGAAWWKLSEFDFGKRSSGPSVRPTSLRFYGSYNVSVQEITIQNSPQCHLKFDSCTSVEVSGVTISSPEISPNTDGIHLQNSRDVEIHHTSIACGDDCVSIQTNCSGIRVHNINCGPGHGISIGALGKDGGKACVSNVSVYNSNISDSSYGVRIKTWQGGVGSVKGVSFSNIQVSNVRIPIDINQFYCDIEACPNRTSAVFIREVTYAKIVSTYIDKPLYLACSNDIPCTDLKLQNIKLKPAVTYEDPFCLNSYGQSNLTFTVDCLQSGRPANDPSGKDAC